MMQSKNLRYIAIFLCLLIIVPYTSIGFLPHTHDCMGLDCAVCALIEASRNTLFGLKLASPIHSANIAFALLIAYKPVSSGNDATPVALKVKLSD